MDKAINGVIWSNEEENKLLSYIEINYTDLEKLSKIFNRSESSIRNKAIKLGIYQRERKAKYWTKKEINYLEDNYPIKSAIIIAKTLNRSVNSIKAKAQSLGIEPDYNSLITASYIAKAIGVYSTTVSDWINKRGLKAKVRRRGKTKFYLLEEEDFWKWAIDNKDCINWSNVNTNMFMQVPYWAQEYIANYKTHNKRKQYTTKEIKVICELKEKPDKYIADKLGRSVQSIRHIRSKINNDLIYAN